MVGSGVAGFGGWLVGGSLTDFDTAAPVQIPISAPPSYGNSYGTWDRTSLRRKPLDTPHKNKKVLKGVSYSPKKPFVICTLSL